MNFFLSLLAYMYMYVIEPGEQKEVQAASDPIGLKIAIIYDASPDEQVLLYQRYQVKNGSTLTGKIREKDMSQFAVVVEALTYQPPLTRAPFRKI
eukprot:gene32758-39598_t